MKITGPGEAKRPVGKRVKQTSTNDAFKTLLDSEIRGIECHDDAVQQDAGSHFDQHRWQLIEKATSLLDEAMSALSAGEQPGEDILQSITRMRSELHQTRNQAANQDLITADTILAVEAERIHILNKQ